MNIFSKLFGKKAPATVEPQDQNQNDEPMIAQDNLIDKSLFTEERHPNEFFMGSEPSIQKRSRKSLLEDLKARDYFRMGMRDGYEEPNFETMDQHVNLIACDFKEVYSLAIQEIDEQLFMIDRTMVPQFEEQMPYEYREVMLQKEKLEEQKRDLKQQFDLAAVGEGYIEKSVEQYKAGFKKGFRQWSNEKLMFQPFNTI
jgi:hypothetical protein